MAKARLGINGMSCQHCVKTVTDALIALEGVQRVKVNLRKGEAIVRYDASYITDANLVEAITAIGFEAVTKIKPLSLRLIGGILITFLSITGCSDMPYIGSMLTAEDVDRYITIGEDSACLLSGHESVCITLIPETKDESRPIIHIHPNKLIYVFYYEGVQIIRAEMVMDTTEIMEQVRGPGEDDQPPDDDGGTQQPDDDDDGIFVGEDTKGGDSGDTQQPGDGDTPRSDGDSGGTQKPDGGTQQPADGSTPRSDGGNGGTQQPPPLPPPPSNGGNQNGNQNGEQNGDGNGNGGNGNGDQNGGTDQNGNQNGEQNGDQNGNGNGGNGSDGNQNRGDGGGNTDITSHYYYHTKQPTITGDGWLVNIYYPENYIGPRGLQGNPNGYGFTVSLAPGAAITQFAQTAGGCPDYDNDGSYDKPCNTVIEPSNPSTYSVQIYIKTMETTLSFTVNWKPPHSHLTKTYTLNAAVNIAQATLDHTSQEDN